MSKTSDPTERPFLNRRHKTSTHRVRERVAYRVRYRFIVTQYAVVEPFLPQGRPGCLAILKAGRLFEVFHELQKIGPVVDGLYHDMEVVGHEAVPRNHKVVPPRSTPNLPKHPFDQRGGDERP